MYKTCRFPHSQQPRLAASIANKLKRVYYTPFSYRHPVEGYSLEPVATPAWRMKRLYQADRLLELYGFSPDDVTPGEEPFLQEDIDPKAAFALRNRGMFPVEVNKADLETLLRVPGIGLTSANRIIDVRRRCTVTHDVLKRIGVSLRRCVYFITCDGKFLGGSLADSLILRSALSDIPNRRLGVQITMSDYFVSF